MFQRVVLGGVIISGERTVTKCLPIDNRIFIVFSLSIRVVFVVAVKLCGWLDSNWRFILPALAKNNIMEIRN